MSDEPVWKTEAEGDQPQQRAGPEESRQQQPQPQSEPQPQQRTSQKQPATGAATQQPSQQRSAATVQQQQIQRQNPAVQQQQIQQQNPAVQQQPQSVGIQSQQQTQAQNTSIQQRPQQQIQPQHLAVQQQQPQNLAVQQQRGTIGQQQQQQHGTMGQQRAGIVMPQQQPVQQQHGAGQPVQATQQQQRPPNLPLGKSSGVERGAPSAIVVPEVPLVKILPGKSGDVVAKRKGRFSILKDTAAVVAPVPQTVPAAGREVTGIVATAVGGGGAAAAATTGVAASATSASVVAAGSPAPSEASPHSSLIVKSVVDVNVSASDMAQVTTAINSDSAGGGSPRVIAEAQQQQQQQQGVVNSERQVPGSAASSPLTNVHASTVSSTSSAPLTAPPLQHPHIGASPAGPPFTSAGPPQQPTLALGTGGTVTKQKGRFAIVSAAPAEPISAGLVTPVDGRGDLHVQQQQQQQQMQHGQQQILAAQHQQIANSQQVGRGDVHVQQQQQQQQQQQMQHGQQQILAAQHQQIANSQQAQQSVLVVQKQQVSQQVQQVQQGQQTVHMIPPQKQQHVAHGAAGAQGVVRSQLHAPNGVVPVAAHEQPCGLFPEKHARVSAQGKAKVAPAGKVEGKGVGAQSAGLGKVFYFIDQMKLEVSEADKTIKALQTDMKFLREKNKDLERRYNEEKNLRESAEVKVKSLKKKVRELKETMAGSSEDALKVVQFEDASGNKSADGPSISDGRKESISEPSECVSDHLKKSYLPRSPIPARAGSSRSKSKSPKRKPPTPTNGKNVSAVSKEAPRPGQAKRSEGATAGPGVPATKKSWQPSSKSASSTVSTQQKEASRPGQIKQRGISEGAGGQGGATQLSSSPRPANKSKASTAVAEKSVSSQMQGNARTGQHQTKHRKEGATTCAESVPKPHQRNLSGMNGNDITRTEPMRDRPPSGRSGAPGMKYDQDGSGAMRSANIPPGGLHLRASSVGTIDSMTIPSPGMLNTPAVNFDPLGPPDQPTIGTQQSQASQMGQASMCANPGMGMQPNAMNSGSMGNMMGSQGMPQAQYSYAQGTQQNMSQPMQNSWSQQQPAISQQYQQQAGPQYQIPSQPHEEQQQQQQQQQPMATMPQQYQQQAVTQYQMYPQPHDEQQQQQQQKFDPFDVLAGRNAQGAMQPNMKGALHQSSQNGTTSWSNQAAS